MSKFEYDKSVRLYYENDAHRGPGKVVQNLVKGLEAIDITAESVFSSRPLKYLGCLQNCYRDLLKEGHEQGETPLMGPNLFVLPSEDPELCKMFEHFVVPSQWVKDLYSTYKEMGGKQIHVWPVGIDTTKWAPVTPRPPWEKLDCFIYFKNRSDQDLQIVEAICKKFGLKYETIKYGQYKEDDLYKLCQTTYANNGFAILLTGTESQGIAYMQILSFNIPCYVFNNPTWKSDDGKVQAPASSVPYFSEQCGEIAQAVSLEHFTCFLENVAHNKYSPRKYIVDNHTLEKSAQKYFDLLKVSHGE